MRRASAFISAIARHLLYESRASHIVTRVSAFTTSSSLARTGDSRHDEVPPGALAESQYNALMNTAKGHAYLPQREQFSLVLREFVKREKFLRGHVEFIALGLRRMEEFGLHQDLLIYNRLLDIFPKGRFKPKNLLDAVWPRPLPQIDLALRLLTKMEEHGVRPDYTTYDLLCEVFGKKSLPVEKCMRLAYWLDKYENADPYRITGTLPETPVELSKLVLQRVCGKDSVITEIKGPDDFVLSANSVVQLKLLQTLERLENALLCVEGPHRIWIKKTEQFYFSITLSPWRFDEPGQSGEGVVLGICMCSPHSHDNLKLWLKATLEQYPALRGVTVAYNVIPETHSMADSTLQLTDTRTVLE